ncbi:hypothetical protein [Hydrogenophaga aquatica]
MYEIWLAINIVYEILRPALPVLALLALAWATLCWRVWRMPSARWAAATKAVLILAVVVTVAVFTLMPAATASSLSELKYWVDWTFLGSVALGIGGLAGMLAWPVLAWLSRRA